MYKQNCIHKNKNWVNICIAIYIYIYIYIYIRKCDITAQNRHCDVIALNRALYHTHQMYGCTTMCSKGLNVCIATS